MIEWWWIMYWKGCGRNWLWSDLRYYPIVLWRNWGKPRKNFVRIIGAPTEIQTGHLPNTSWKRYLLMLSKKYSCMSTYPKRWGNERCWRALSMSTFHLRWWDDRGFWKNGQTSVLTRHLPEEMEENLEKLHLQWSALRPRFELFLSNSSLVRYR
jgi:hypothetical protein